MPSENARKARILNERVMLSQLCAANPDKLGLPRVGLGDHWDIPTLMVVSMNVVSAVLRGDSPVVGPIHADLAVTLSHRHPMERPVLALNTEPSLELFVGGMIVVCGVGRVCAFRTYDPERHSVVQHVINAYNILAGRTVASERDCLNPRASKYWLDHPERLPFDSGLNIPGATVTPREDRSHDFVLEEV